MPMIRTMIPLNEVQLVMERKTPRHKRFERSRTPPPYRFHEEGDLPILRLLRDYRFLTVNELSLLLPRGIVVLRARLKVLYQNGVVDRPRNQRNPFAAAGPVVYSLGNKGADALAQYGELVRGKVNWQKKNAEVGLPYMEHGMMVARLRATLTLATRGDPKVKLAHWELEGNALNSRVLVGGEWLPIRPDGFFTLEVLGKQRPYKHFAVEADRSTMSDGRFLSKMVAYWQGRREYRELLEIENFRVLTICRSEQRAENLRQATRQADEQQQGSAMFLFTCERNYALEAPESVLGPIWKCPGCEVWHSLVE